MVQLWLTQHGRAPPKLGTGMSAVSYTGQISFCLAEIQKPSAFQPVGNSKANQI